MPGFDGTGPRGQGPMTGGGWGNCVMPLPIAGDRPFQGHGNFSGPRGGRGRRNRYYATGLAGWQRATVGEQSFGRGYGAGGTGNMVPQDEVQMLRNQAQVLEQQLADIQKRISTFQETGNNSEK